MKDLYSKNINSWLRQLSSNKKLHWLILVILPLAIYCKAIFFSFVEVDDQQIILDHLDFFLHLKNIPAAFHTDCFIQPIGMLYRPIQTVSFILDAQIGHNAPWMYHLSNIIIHIFTSLSIYYFLQFLEIKRTTAFVFALIFSIHPILTSNVSWISTRGDELLAPFGIWLFIFFGKFIKSGKWIYLVLHVIFFALSLFTKETAILFPLLLLFYYKFILKNIPFKTSTLVILFLSWSNVTTLYYFIRKSISINAPITTMGIIPFLKDLPTIPTVIGKFFIPYNLSTLPLYDTFSTMVGIAIMLPLIYITIQLFKEKQWLFILGILWFLFFIIPPMFMRIKDAEYFIEYYEHRTYLPIPGLIIAMACLADRYLPKISAKKTALISVLIITILSCLAWVHCDDYKNKFAFYTAAINSNSNNASASLNRSGCYVEKKEYAKALNDLTHSIKIHKSALAYLDRGYLFMNLGNYPAAEKDFLQAIIIEPGNTTYYIELSKIKEKQQDHFAAINYLQKAAKYDPNNAEIYFNLGILLGNEHNFKEATDNFSKAIELNPRYAYAYYCRALIEHLTNEPMNACNDWYISLQLGNQQAKGMLDQFCGKNNQH